MSTKIYNGMIAQDVNTISDLSKFKSFLKDQIDERNKSVIFEQFNEFFSWYLEQLFVYKGNVHIKEIMLYLKFHEELFSGIYEVMDVKAEKEHLEYIIERNLSNNAIDRRITNILKNQTQTTWDQFGLDMSEDNYYNDLFLVYLSCFLGFIHVLNSYSTFFSKFMGNDSMYKINSVYMFPLESGRLLMYTLSDNLYSELIRTDKVDDYHYQNQTDEPDDVEHHEWEQRKDDWNEAIRHRIDEGICLGSTGEDLHQYLFFLNGSKMSDTDKMVCNKLKESFDNNVEKMTRVSKVLVKEAIMAKEFFDAKSSKYYKKKGLGTIMSDIQDYCDNELSDSKREYFLNLLEASRYKFE